jgi:hypothetical protein
MKLKVVINVLKYLCFCLRNVGYLLHIDALIVPEELIEFSGRENFTFYILRLYGEKRHVKISVSWNST